MLQHAEPRVTRYTTSRAAKRRHMGVCGVTDRIGHVPTGAWCGPNDEIPTSIGCKGSVRLPQWEGFQKEKILRCNIGGFQRRAFIGPRLVRGKVSADIHLLLLCAPNYCSDRQLLHACHSCHLSWESAVL